jgi:hypothetical protein
MPLINICRYKVKPGKEAEMEKLLALHWPALHAAGLATDEPAIVYRGLPSGKPGDEHGAERTYVEILVWKDRNSPRVAHETPEVMAVWEPMGAICESMDFPSFERLELPRA